MPEYRSWGSFPKARQESRRITGRDRPLPPLPAESTALPRGLGRSYGDSCLNDGGVLLDATGLDHFIEFDAADGRLRCEAGVSLATILDTLAPRGWFPPVTPGTKFVTVGGAVANDVHGKNHHRGGTFGRYLTRFELLRSNGERLLCSPESHPELYRATIGGLGLTGLLTWVELRMKRIASERIDVESVRFGSLDEFFDLSADSDTRFEYTAAWIDGFAGGGALGRGLFLRGNHSAEAAPAPRRRRRTVSVPGFGPEFLLNRFSIRAANLLYYHRQRREVVRRKVHYEPFFYPLDAIGQWNYLYGRRGFMQYQCFVPHEDERAATREILRTCVADGSGPFLVVLKLFGDLPSPGLLSFPRPGVTLCLDFPNLGRRTLELLETLDRIVRGRGGRVYPAKDARMSAASFQAYYPEWREFARWIDPAFSSSFWRRVTAPVEGE